jgi:hypothetical protein
MTDKERAYSLLTVLQSYAPDAGAQQLCTDEQAQARRDNPRDPEGVRYAALAIADGLMYGNWPWTLTKMFGPRT